MTLPTGGVTGGEVQSSCPTRALRRQGRRFPEMQKARLPPLPPLLLLLFFKLLPNLDDSSFNEIENALEAMLKAQRERQETLRKVAEIMTQFLKS